MSWKPLSDLFNSSLYRDYHSLIPFIPFISVYLIYSKRQFIYSEKAYSFIVGLTVMIAGSVLYLAGRQNAVNFNQTDYASFVTLSAVIFFWGAFIFAYGKQAFEKALFPLLFLVFVIPMPVSVMNRLISFLQIGSTEFTNMLIVISGVPFLREGFVFHLPGQSVEVARECSGIRSGLALFITALLAGHLFLNTWWRRVLFALLAIPMTMFKNGIRITTLTLLGTYVDPRILQSSLHREGGIPFFIVALLLMAPILFFLRKTEKARRQEENIGDRET